MKYLSKDVWIGFVMLLGSALYWLNAQDIPISPLDGAVNAAVVPKMLAGTLGFLSLLLIVQGLIRARFRSAPPEPEDQPSSAAAEPGRQQRLAHHARAVGLLALGAAYLLVLPWLGYLLSIALLMGAVALYMGAVASWRFLATVAVLALAYQLLFVQLLNIQLPRGVLPAFLF